MGIEKVYVKVPIAINGTCCALNCPYGGNTSSCYLFKCEETKKPGKGTSWLRTKTCLDAEVKKA
jgi:hypothetical protein